MSPPKPPRRKPDDEATIVNKLLRQLPHADPSLKGDPEPPTPSPGARPQGMRPAPRPPPPPNVQGAWGRALVGVVLAGAMPFWPYANACGFPLYGYLAVVSLVLVVGLWSAAFAWRERAAIPHVLALLVTGWGAVLAAERVLPRVGYARAEATWACITEQAPVEIPAPTLSPMMVTDTMIPVADSLTADSGAAPDTTR